MHRLPEPGELETADRRVLLAARDVRTRLVVSLAALVAVASATRLALPLGVAGCCIGSWIVAGLPLGRLLRRLAGPLGLAAVLCVLQSLLTGKTPLATWDWRFVHLAFTQEGLRDGLQIGVRVLGAMCVVISLGASTTAQELFAALRWLRLPATWIEVALLMVRYIFLLFDQAESIVSAQSVRLGYATPWRGLRTMGSLAGLVVLHSLDQAERSHEAMLARGYQGATPAAPLPRLPVLDWLILGAALALFVGGTWIAEGWPR